MQGPLIGSSHLLRTYNLDRDNKPKQVFSKVQTILGLLCATSSLISLTSRVLHVGLAPIFRDYIAYYRSIVTSLVQPLVDLISIPPPAFYYDLWPLSFIGAASHYWAFSHQKNMKIANTVWGAFFFSRAGKPVVILLVGLTMTGIFAIIAALVVSVLAVFIPEEQRDQEFLLQSGTMHRLLTYCCLVAFGTILFFLLNAYAPGVKY